MATELKSVENDSDSRDLEREILENEPEEESGSSMFMMDNKKYQKPT